MHGACILLLSASQHAAAYQRDLGNRFPPPIRNAIFHPVGSRGGRMLRPIRWGSLAGLFCCGLLHSAKYVLEEVGGAIVH